MSLHPMLPARENDGPALRMARAPQRSKRRLYFDMIVYTHHPLPYRYRADDHYPGDCEHQSDAEQAAGARPAYAKMTSRYPGPTQWPKAVGVVIGEWKPRRALRAHRHSGTDAGNSHRARRMALACKVVGEDDITRSKTARGPVTDPDFHLPLENKNVLPPGRGVPIARIVRREAAEHEVGARLNRNVVTLLSRQREILKMCLAVLASI
jgi:hypothetical protein